MQKVEVFETLKVKICDTEQYKIAVSYSSEIRGQEWQDVLHIYQQDKEQVDIAQKHAGSHGEDGKENGSIQ